MSDRMRRRMFLRGVGGSVLMVPFLPSLLRTARAQEQAGAPRRYVQLFYRFGRPPEHYYPADPTEQVAPHVYRRRLADYDGDLSYILDSAWDGLRDKVSLIRGLDGMCVPYNNHSLAFPTTGGANQPGTSGTDPPAAFKYSIDCVLDEQDKVYPLPPQIRNLQLTPLNPGQGMPGDTPHWSYSWRAVGHNTNRPITAIESVDAAFTAVFGNGAAGQAPDDTPIRQKRKLVDLVLEDYRRVASRPRLSGEDRTRLGNYMDLMSEVQGRLMVQRAACEALEPGQSPDNVRLHDNAFDVLVAALACDVTRVAGYTLSQYAWTDTAPSMDLHTAAHDDQDFNRIHIQWYAQRAAALMSRMDAITEANGNTLLDNSIVYFGSGAAQGDHGHIDQPVLVGGSANGRLRTGEYIDYRQRPFVGVPQAYGSNQARRLDVGRPYNDLLVTFLRAMGLVPEDWRRLGQTRGFGFYNLEDDKDLAPIYAQFLDGDRDAGLPHYLL